MQGSYKKNLDGIKNFVEKVENGYPIKETEVDYAFLSAAEFGKTSATEKHLRRIANKLCKEIHSKLVKTDIYKENGAKLIFTIVEPNIDFNCDKYEISETGKGKIKDKIYNSLLRGQSKNKEGKEKKFNVYGLSSLAVFNFSKNKPTKNKEFNKEDDFDFKNYGSKNTIEFEGDEFKSIENLCKAAGLKGVVLETFLLYKNGFYENNKIDIEDGKKITYKTVADHLRIPLGTVQSRINLATEDIRKHLRQTYPDDQMIMYYAGPAKGENKDLPNMP